MSATTFPDLGAPPPVRRRWGHLAVLTTALSMDTSEASVLTALFPAIRASLGLSLTDLGILSAASRLSGAVCSPFWIWAARRWNRKYVLALAAGLWGLWGIAAGFASGFGMLLLFYCVLATGFAGAPPIITEILSDLFDDRTRGRAVGMMYGSVSLLGSVIGPLVGQLSGIPDGWRYGFWGIGCVNLLSGLLIMLLFRDPGLGASEPGFTRGEAARGARTARPRLSTRAALSVFRIPSFNLMLLSRLLSGHLTIAAFGVVFLVSVRHFPNKVAALVLAPFGIGYFCGTIGGSYVVDRMNLRWPRTGRVLFLQLAQLAFAVVAYFATQFDWGGDIGIYLGFWFAMGFLQGVNPGVNRPIVMSVIPPELRAWAFAVMLAMVESIAWGLYNLGAGWFGDRYGLQAVFLVVLVGIMVVNALAIVPLYRTYGPDADRVRLRARDAAG